MERILKDERGPEREAVTSTCEGTKETEYRGLSYETVMESNSGLLDNSQTPTLEMLTNEIINTGTQASLSPPHKGSSQGSHDASPSNDNTQGIRDSTLPDGLESSHAVVETATEERHVDSESRDIKDDNKELETSSDDTDEWETASEESAALDPEPHDQDMDGGDTGSYCQEIICKDAGPHGHVTFNEDGGLHGHETLSEDTGPPGHETLSEDTGPPGHETLSEDTGSPGHKTLSEDTGPPGHKTLSEEAGFHGHETLREDTGHLGPETLSEDAGSSGLETLSDDVGSNGLVMLSEDTGPAGHDMLSEDSGSSGHETLSENAGSPGHETLSEDAWIHGHETLSEEAWIHGHAMLSEDADPSVHGILSEDTRTCGHETVSAEVEPLDKKAVSENIGLHSHGAVSEEAESLGQETVSDGIHGLERISKDTGHNGQETHSEDIGPHSCEQSSENAEPPSHETLSEDAGLCGHETVSEEAEAHSEDIVNENDQSHSYRTVKEEAEPHGEEKVSEEGRLHGQETVNEVDELHGLESVGEEIVPFGLEMSSKEPPGHGDMKTDNMEATLHSQDTSSQETVEAELHGQEMVSEETGSNEETVSELVMLLGNETVSDMTRPHCSNADTELQDNERIGGMESEELDEVCKISDVPDQTLNDVIVNMSEEATDDKKETLSTERPDEILETVRDEIKSESIYDDGVHKGTIGHGTHGGFETVCELTHNASRERDPDKTLDVHIETVNEGVPNICKETFHEETQVVHTERDHEEKQAVYKGVDSREIQGMYTETTLQETLNSEDTKAGDASMAIMEISVRKEDVPSEEQIVIELSSEERELANNQARIKSNEDCKHNDEMEEASRVLDQHATNEDELDNEVSKQKWDLVTEDMEIAHLEGERLEEKLHGNKTLVETGEGLSEDVPNLVNQETVLELQYGRPITTDENLHVSCIMDIESQLDVPGPSLMEEKGQVEYAKTLDVIETKSIEPEYIRPTDTQIEPSDNQGLGYKAEPEVQVVSSDGQGIGEPCLQLSGLHTEQSPHSKDDSSIGLQNQLLGDPEPQEETTTTVEILDPQNSPWCSQVDLSSQEIPQDEPDHCTLDIFPITLKNIRFSSEDLVKHGSKSKDLGLLPENIDTECISGQETIQESVKELVHQESTFGDIHPVIVLDQDTMTPGSETANITVTNLENIKSVSRQRSNTDPYLIHDQEDKLQVGSNIESGRLRSLTPPCDKFTSSSTPTSPKTLEQSTTSLLYPMPDENKTSYREEDPSAKKYVFYPTQIFNPMLLLGHTQESGFYQEETFRQDNMEKTSRGFFQSPHQDNQVLLQTQNLQSVVEPKSSLKSTEGNSNTKPMPIPSVAPVWLPPQPTRYSGGVNEMKSMKPLENPLVRRATIRHKKSNVGDRPAAKRFSSPNLPAIPQKYYPEGPGTSSLPKIQTVNVNKVQISSRNKHLPHQQKISEETGPSRSTSSMETVREEGQHPTVKEKPCNSPESVLLRGTRSKTKPPSSDPSIHRRYSTFINSSNLLYQEYSDVALNQEIQRQKPGDSPAEDSQPSSPRVRRRLLSSQDSYLQRLSISSADSLWQDIPKIRDSVTFLSMTREEQKLQEAKFELIMSEALYLRSLNIAVDHFQRSTELQEVLSAQDRQWLFSRLSEVRDASSDFLFDLEEEFESNMYKFQVCDVVISHVPTFRRVYLPYVTNQSYQDRTFQRLMTDTPGFQQLLAKLESDPVCQRLSLKSFLILPFQRITRMRLLLQNILKRSAPGSTEELQATEAHNALEKLIRDCNGSVQRMKDTEELILLNQKIQFECKIFPLISQSRRLVKHGEVTSLEFNSMSFKWKVTSRPVYLHLFNDCLLLSRVREGGRFVVFDHSSEFRVERCEIKLHTNQKNIFRVFLRDSAAMGRESSQDVRETEYIFRTETQSQKLRWICALSPPREEIDFWRDHGLSQNQCLKSYKARENDELSLEKADILMITQNSDDGWLHGIRLSDQQSGWFPQANVQPISRNACIRNLQEEQRLQNARAKLQPTGAKGQ